MFRVFRIVYNSVGGSPEVTKSGYWLSSDFPVSQSPDLTFHNDGQQTQQNSALLVIVPPFCKTVLVSKSDS